MRKADLWEVTKDLQLAEKKVGATAARKVFPWAATSVAASAAHLARWKADRLEAH